MQTRIKNLSATLPGNGARKCLDTHKYRGSLQFRCVSIVSIPRGVEGISIYPLKYECHFPYYLCTRQTKWLKDASVFGFLVYRLQESKMLRMQYDKWKLSKRESPILYAARGQAHVCVFIIGGEGSQGLIRLHGINISRTTRSTFCQVLIFFGRSHN